MLNIFLQLVISRNVYFLRATFTFKIEKKNSVKKIEGIRLFQTWYAEK